MFSYFLIDTRPELIYTFLLLYTTPIMHKRLNNMLSMRMWLRSIFGRAGWIWLSPPRQREPLLLVYEYFEGPSKLLESKKQSQFILPFPRIFPPLESNQLCRIALLESGVKSNLGNWYQMDDLRTHQSETTELGSSAGVNQVSKLSL